MPTWIPILTVVLAGVLAFLGAVAGHFVAFHLNAAAKRRDVRRAQIERFAEFMSEDITWMSHFAQETLFGRVDFQKLSPPSDKAQAIFMLYFFAELANPMKQFMVARREYEAALGVCYSARLRVAAADNQPLEQTRAPDANIDLMEAKHPVYYKAVLDNLSAASIIAEETIPEKSQVARWCADSWARLRSRFARKT